MDGIGVLGGVLVIAFVVFLSVLVPIIITQSYPEKRDCELIYSAPCEWQMMPVLEEE